MGVKQLSSLEYPHMAHKYVVKIKKLKKERDFGAKMEA